MYLNWGYKYLNCNNVRAEDGQENQETKKSAAHKMERHVQLNQNRQRTTTLCISLLVWPLPARRKARPDGSHLLSVRHLLVAVLGVDAGFVKSDTAKLGEAWQQGSQRGKGPQRDSMYANAATSRINSGFPGSRLPRPWSLYT